MSEVSPGSAWGQQVRWASGTASAESSCQEVIAIPFRKHPIRDIVLTSINCGQPQLPTFLSFCTLRSASLYLRAASRFPSGTLVWSLLACCFNGWPVAFSRPGHGHLRPALLD